MIAAGGTGGHVYPALAVAEAALQSDPKTELVFVGSVDGFERPLVEAGGVSFLAYHEVQAGPIHGVNVLRAIQSAFLMLLGTGQALALIRRYRPQVVLLTGGWVGFPVALAAWLSRVPSLIYLPDIEPGLAIRVLRRLATQVAVTAPESQAYFPAGQTVVTGYPLRRALMASTRDAAIQHFNLDPTCPTLLVFGGSRGAQTINSALVDVLPRLLADGVQVIHVAGTLDYVRVKQSTASLAAANHYHLFDYLHSEQMGLAFAAADVAVCRSGASVIGEFPYFGLPSVLIPYPFAWRYQKVNADYLAERGAAIHLPDEQLNSQLYPILHGLFTDAPRLVTMKANVRRLAHPDSAAHIAKLLAQLAAGESPL